MAFGNNRLDGSWYARRVEAALEKRLGFEDVGLVLHC